MEQQAIFKKRFRGFDKVQVLSYIDGQTSDYHKTIEEKDAAIADLQAKLDEQAARAAAIDKERAAAVTSYEKQMEEHHQVLEAMKNLGEEYGRLKKEVAEKSVRLRESESRLSVYETDKLKNEFTKKQIADAYIAAQQGAKDILDGAKKEAEKETAAARRERDFLMIQVGKLRDEVDRLKDRLKETLDEIEDRVDEFQLHFEGFEDTVGARIPDMEEGLKTPEMTEKPEAQADNTPEAEQIPSADRTDRHVARPSVKVYAKPTGRGFSEKVSDVFKKWL